MLAVLLSRACSTRCYRSMVALHRSLMPVISWLSSQQIVQQPKPVAKQPVKKAPHFTKADFEEILAVENDLINGRGAWLYSQLEKELARERKRAQAERQFEALRAESYKYNF